MKKRFEYVYNKKNNNTLMLVWIGNNIVNTNTICGNMSEEQKQTEEKKYESKDEKK